MSKHIFIFYVFLYIFAFSNPAHALYPELHSTIDYEASLVPGVPSETAIYAGAPEDCINKNRDNICEGAYDEDADRDPRITPGAWSGFFNWGSHFWQPAGGATGGLLENVGGLSVNLESQNAYQRARMLYDSAKTLYNENPSYAYYLLGRIGHLLSDIATPAHVHLDAHFSDVFLGDDSFEEYTRIRYVTADRLSGISALETDFPVSGIVPADYKNLSDAGFPGEPLLFRIFYSMATTAAAYDSDDADGTKDKGIRRGRSVNIANTSLINAFAVCTGCQDRILSSEEYQLSLARRKFILLNSTIDTLNHSNPPYEEIRLDFTGGSEIHTLTEFIKTDIGDRDMAIVSNLLLPAALSNTAALYQLFWAETHPSLDNSIPNLIINSGKHRLDIIKPGPLDIKIDIASMGWKDTEVELYIWLDASLSGKRMRFYFDGIWQPFETFNELRPIFKSFRLSDIQGVVWRVIDDSSLLPDMNFNINLCLDRITDGYYTPAESICSGVLVSVRQ